MHHASTVAARGDASLGSLLPHHGPNPCADAPLVLDEDEAGLPKDGIAIVSPLEPLRVLGGVAVDAADDKLPEGDIVAKLPYPLEALLTFDVLGLLLPQQNAALDKELFEEPLSVMTFDSPLLLRVSLACVDGRETDSNFGIDK